MSCEPDCPGCRIDRERHKLTTIGVEDLPLLVEALTAFLDTQPLDETAQHAERLLDQIA